MLKLFTLEMTNIPPRFGVVQHGMINSKGGEMDIGILGEEGFLEGKGSLYSKP